MVGAISMTYLRQRMLLASQAGVMYKVKGPIVNLCQRLRVGILLS